MSIHLNHTLFGSELVGTGYKVPLQYQNMYLVDTKLYIYIYIYIFQWKSEYMTTSIIYYYTITLYYNKYYFYIPVHSSGDEAPVLAVL